MKINYYGMTDTGRKRKNNEDAFVAESIDNSAVLTVVIDGVGGYEGGEVAAEIAQNEIPAYLKEFTHGEHLELLKQAVVSANNAIVERRLYDYARQNMCCVLTAALIDAERGVVNMVHVGDTRLYLYHEGLLVKLSHDHSPVGYLEDNGEITEEEAMHHQSRNIVDRVVGSEKHLAEDEDFLEAEVFPMVPNSLFLLCSDGLTDLIISSQIVEILEEPKSLEEKTKSLIAAANEAGGKDNITVVLVECIEDCQNHKIGTSSSVELSTTNQNPPITGRGSQIAGHMSINRRWKVLIVAITAIATMSLSLSCFNLWKLFNIHNSPNNNLEFITVNTSEGVYCDSVEEPTIMHDVYNTNVWKKYGYMEKDALDISD